MAGIQKSESFACSCCRLLQAACVTLRPYQFLMLTIMRPEPRYHKHKMCQTSRSFIPWFHPKLATHTKPVTPGKAHSAPKASKKEQHKEQQVPSET